MNDFTPDNFDKNGFYVIREALPESLRRFLEEYFNIINAANMMENGDAQVPGSKCVYGDPAFDSLLSVLLPYFSRDLNKELIPQYSYARIYHEGDELLPHLDRNECEISATICIHSDSIVWPIYFNNKEMNDGKEVVLNPGDLCVYKGTEMVHFREKYYGSTQYQIFLHYTDANGPFNNVKFDSREKLGIKKC